MNHEAHELRVECSRLAAENSDTALEAAQKALDLYQEQVGIAVSRIDSARRALRLQAIGLRQTNQPESTTAADDYPESL